jgi:hypothetical protein
MAVTMRSMRKMKTGLLLGALMCVTAGSLFAHHAVWSIYDSAKVVQRKGVIVRFAQLSPHNLVFVDSTGANGEMEHWALEAPSIVGLGQRNPATQVFKPGDAIEFCGYETKGGIAALKSHQEPEPISLSLKNVPRPVVTGRLLYPEVLVLASGQRVQWATDERKCL